MNKMIVQHPSVNLQADWVKTIRNTSAEAEKSGKIHPDQLAVIYEQQWFKLLAPAVYSGLEKSIPELVRLEESISWANGSVGWVVTLCSGAGWFGGFIQTQIAATVFNNSWVCLAGSGAATGEAIITPDGYKITGIWKYASGAHHATHFTANCIIKNGTETVLQEDGSPLVLPFIFERENVKILPSWKYTGMVATGSDAFEINEQEVTDQHCFKIDDKAAVIKSPLYQYPFLQLAEATLAVNISGMAIHFLDLCAEIFIEKQQSSKLTIEQKKFLKQVLTKQENRLNKARQLFYQAVDISWHNIEHGISESNVMEDVSLYSRSLAKISRECVDLLYPYCGLMAANTDTEINQVWRDLHTASQHALLTFV
jgi:alkylation response protein AidB-like acyl-CoA dehydrogenase